MSQENVEIVQRYIHAGNRGDVDAMEAVLTPDFELDFSRASGPYRGVYQLDNWRQLLGDFAEAFESIRTEPDEFIDAGERVVVPHTHYFRGRDGIETRARDTWVTIRDGAIARICLYPERREALEAAGLEE
jgi:ketosteroid isomerase-like protein